jgi:SAM-dependent methyltransferase
VTVPVPPPSPCRICGGRTAELGAVHGAYSARDYHLWRCQTCRYAFVADPWTDFARIYDDAYYAGRGADPLVDYQFELDHARDTVRVYEWRGLTAIVQTMLGSLDGVRWLDFGAGNGGLVRHVNDHTAARAEGFEDGSIAGRARALEIPVRASLDEVSAEQWDVVSAIEVLEHVLDPLAELRRIRRLLRPGGLLLLTTGNAAPFAGDLMSWPYVIPEIHISFYEPSSLSQALSRTGFRPAPMPRAGGFDDVLKFKVLKNLRVRRRNPATDLIPAHALARLADRRVHLRAHPVGIAV